LESEGRPAVAELGSCIQCGLCLEACPTYRETGDEGLSARGRIILLRALSDTDFGADGEAGLALDLCLLCGSCAAVCPADVPYEGLLCDGRERLPGARALGRRERRVLGIVRAFFKRPRLLKSALGLVRWAAGNGLAGTAVRLATPPEHRGHFLDLLASLTLPAKDEVPPAWRTARRAGARSRARAGEASSAGATDGLHHGVAIFRGCVTPAFFPQVLEALESILRRAGIAFVTPRRQACCGALHFHSGDLDGARELARRNVAAFEEKEDGWIVAEAAGCAAMLKTYGNLLADDPECAERAARFSARVRDATELLYAMRAPRAAVESPLSSTREPARPKAATGRGEQLTLAPVTDQADAGTGRLRVVYQDACRLRHVQGIVQEPRELLDALPGVERVSAPEETLCCGAAGIYQLLQPGMAAMLGERKAGALAVSGAALVVTADPGCRLQLAGRLQRHALAVRHILEVCDHCDGASPAEER
jgi:glycolate oxidase iron-sulfur subunit